LQTVTQIVSRAGSLLSQNISLSTTYAHTFINDFIDELGMDIPEEMEHTMDASTSIRYALPDNFVNLVKVWDERAGCEYSGVRYIRAGKIELGDAGEYTLIYNRLPGPLRHFRDDTSNLISSTECKTIDQMVTLIEEVKADYDLHIATTNLHATTSTGGDTYNASTASTSTSTSDYGKLQESIAMYNDLYTKMPAHFAQSGIHITDDYKNSLPYTLTTSASTSTSGSTSTSAYMAINDMARKFTSHIESGLPPDALRPAAASYLAYRWQVRENREHPDLPRLENNYLRDKQRGLAGIQTGEESRFREGW
jgi:hypothetical protein